MKIEHKNITAFVDTEGTETGVHGSIVPVTLLSGNGLDRIKKIHTLIVSPSTDVDAVIDLYFRYKVVEPPTASVNYDDDGTFVLEESVNYLGGAYDDLDETITDGDNKPEDDDSAPNTESRKLGLRSNAEAVRTDTLYYIFKSLTIPKTTAFDVTAGFPNGIPYSTKYDLILKLGGSGQAVSLILHYE